MASKKNSEKEINAVRVHEYEKLKAQLTELLQEMSRLSVKHPDNPINKFKLSFINEKLTEANKLLQGIHKPMANFDSFEEDSLPTNSDVTIVLSQYLSCLEGWRCANIFKQGIEWFWKGTKIRAEQPTRKSTVSNNIEFGLDSYFKK